MAIKVIYKLIRPNNGVSWYNRDGVRWKAHSAFNAISKSVNSSNPSTFVERTLPDDLTIICTYSWPDLSTYNATVGDYDASSNSAWKSYADAKGTYEEENNITTIRYIYDTDDNLTSTQKRVRKVYWEDYSE